VADDRQACSKDVRMTSNEYAAKAIQLRGYAVIANHRPLPIGHRTFPAYAQDVEPSDQPMCIVAETDQNDFVQQAKAVVGRKPPGLGAKYYFYRVVTD
jgi:hypothetical protein